jgi:hypothetical protein
MNRVAIMPGSFGLRARNDRAFPTSRHAMPDTP